MNKKTKKTTGLLLVLTAVLGMILAMSSIVYADDTKTAVTYMDATVDPTTHAVTYTSKDITDYIPVSTISNDTSYSWGSDAAWYVVDSDVTIDGGIDLNNTVNLILCDDKTLTINGTLITTDETLNIYCQSKGTGKLIVSGAFAGIGGGPGGAGGTVTINGGKVTATGGYGAGIGGGYNGAGGTVTINGGKVTATGGSGGAGIGGGDYGAGGTVTINGGTVTATGGSGAGIGGGYNGAGGTVTINGGTVTATGGREAAGIGGGTEGNGGEVTITGGTVIATGVCGGAGIGGGYSGACGDVTISGGTVTASGSIYPWGQNHIGQGIGAGGGKTDNGKLTVDSSLHVYGGDTQYPTTLISKDGGAYPRHQFMIINRHNFTYSVNDATITATCSDTQCDLTGKKVSLTINKPERTTYEEPSDDDTNSSAEATLTGQDAFKAATGQVLIIKYEGIDGTSYSESETAPENAGSYIAKVTAGGVTASVEYAIAKAECIAPVGKTGLTYTGSAQDLVEAGNTSGGEVQYAIGENANTAPADDSGNWSTSIPQAIDAGTYYVWYRIKGDANHKDVEAACLTVTIAAAPPAPPDIEPTETDKKAASAVTDSIISLPEEITSADAEAVAEARAAYDALTPAQKELVTEETLKKLEEAETAIANWQQFDSDAAAAAAITTEFVKVKAKKGRKAVVTWTPAEGNTGYLVQYSRNKKFTKKLKEKEVTADKAKLKIKKLKKGKKYFFRICTYTDVPNPATGTTERVNGAWSKTWKVKAKK